MVAVSVSSIFVASVAIYLTTKIDDEVFKVGMAFVALVFGLVTLICAPWILKLLVMAIPLFFGNLGNVSNLN
ncbi:conserved hypothetical protein [Hyella patelloides LEGE 07179]|uniref:Uncharacterized protein n=1 Tax=Hyella patelloides LEGE 07179 TaxID=945734 RepID=A0A563VUE2_9CYAN|nr:hypothetical protein [Hyella patelloides]VEP15023.1 conserved hypothetical protein [Hyella patelloides LEGE 07179]